MIFLVYCIASLFYYVFVCVSCPYVIYYPTVMVRYSLFVLKVPLNPKQTNKQTLGRIKEPLEDDVRFFTGWNMAFPSPANSVKARK